MLARCSSVSTGRRPSTPTRTVTTPQGPGAPAARRLAAAPGDADVGALAALGLAIWLFQRDRELRALAQQLAGHHEVEGRLAGAIGGVLAHLALVDDLADPVAVLDAQHALHGMPVVGG